MITNINTGLCHWRTTNNQPPYFVNYQIDGQQQYIYFAMRWSAEEYKNKLIQQQKTQLQTN